MGSVTYEIAPDGDIELVLNKPNEQNIIPRLRLNAKVVDFDDSRFVTPTCEGRYAVFNKLYAKWNLAAADCKVHFRVSSHHLKLASRPFRKMLEGPWKEASSSEPLRQINATGWDVMAFVIVLDAIHGRHQGIPKISNTGLVTRIATVIDYYECHDALYAYFDRWLTNNLSMIVLPSALYRKTLMCLYVAWVFSDEAKFNSVSQVVLRCSEGLSRIDTSDIPLGGLLERIETERRDLLGCLFDKLDAVQTSLLKEKRCPGGHDSGCVCQTLGRLMRVRHKLASDHHGPPEYPYDGYSIDEVLNLISDIEGPYVAGYSACNIARRLHAVFDDVRMHMICYNRARRVNDTLKLDEYRRRRKTNKGRIRDE
ncbi:uncharacterized protein B0J16DRAFT_408252 [Fusarium flagelliforme]|uniref:uncharacterized protein n=1 Tax=Fusarium flagelliforme TaxID=2675880 RepID=UPI001E8D80CA|nr:uncharacterized protein B0J16DRAFT_408252 [Fusarium flagelliforme]KAH7196548.1 hypothetical protein B0J16DRAFT_408252 [Fusarium flagelliforme]